MPASPHPRRVVIVGASSLRGKELNQLLEERNFPADDIRLVDDEAVGKIAEAGGEATFIRALEEDSFENARFIFFAGDAAFTARVWPAAHKAGATVIDLSGALADVPMALAWIPALDVVLSPPRPVAGKLFASPDAAAMLACTVAAALAHLDVTRIVLVFFQPVSERGQAGIDELETQTVNLLSFQSAPQDLYDTQVAFNLLPRYGEASLERLGERRVALARQVERYLAGRAPIPAIQLIQAPVFYASAFSGYVEFGVRPNAEDVHAAFGRAGVRISAGDQPPLSNISIAGETHMALASVEADPLLPKGFWLWGAADNLRASAANAVTIGEKLLNVRENGK